MTTATEPSSASTGRIRCRVATMASALANPITLASCVGENGITLSDVLGVSNVTYESKAAFAIAVTVPNDSTKARLLVVGVTCGPGGAQLLAEETVVR